MRTNTRTDYVNLVALQQERRKRMAEAERVLETERAVHQANIAFWWIVFGLLSLPCLIIVAIEKGWW